MPHEKPEPVCSFYYSGMQDDGNGRSQVRVVVRMREGSAQSEDIKLEPDGKSITLRQTTTSVDPTAGAKQELLSFSCDATLSNASQERTFDIVGRPAVDACLAGYNGTVLCYGQTGAGKSFTMVGSKERYQQRGLIPRAIGHIFKAAEADTAADYSVRFSCLEIYNDQMYDLLSTLPSDGTERRELSLAEHRGKVEIKGQLAPEVESEEHALQLLFEAESNRAVAQHQLNQLSSRSHVLYMLRIDKRSKVANGRLTSCRLTLVDLAGSERLKKAANTALPLENGGSSGGAAKQLAKEAMSINKSLSFLEQVVVALAKRGQSHVPHRSCKLTAVLRESLGGNCKTVLVANVWPESRHMEETLSTLKFAARMSSVSNNAVINAHAEVSPAQALVACQSQVAELKRELAMHDQLAGRGHVSYEPYTPAQRSSLREQVKSYVAGSQQELEAATLRQVRETYDLFRQLFNEQAAQLRAAEERAANVAASAGPAYGYATKDGAGFGGGGGGGGGGAEPMAGGVTLMAEADPGPVEVVNLVGGDELGGGASGFGCGVAPADARPSDPQFGGAAAAMGVGGRRASAESMHMGGVGGRRVSAESMLMGNGGGGGSEANPNVFFAEYKSGAGAELHALLLENKATLREHKTAQRRHALEVNSAKREIDEVKRAIEHKKEMRKDAPPMNTGGVAAEVIDDEEFSLLQALKQAKGKYRAAFDSLTDERATVEYVSGTVENCRSQLLTDFSSWLQAEHPEAAASASVLMAHALSSDSTASASGYGSGYGGGLTPRAGAGGASGLVMGIGGGAGAAGGDKPPTPYDQDEQFERLADDIALSEDPDSLPFFKASKLATARSLKKSKDHGNIRTKDRPFQ
jgi:kinesin family protein 6/9